MKFVCLGDSLTYGFMVRRREAYPCELEKIIGHEVLNKGIPGDTSNGMLARFYSDVVDRNPECVLIMGGINDMFMGMGEDFVAMNLFSMVNQGYNHMITPIVILPPRILENTMGMDSDKINAMTRRIKERLKGFNEIVNFLVIDLYDVFAGIPEEDYSLDGVHLNHLGYKLMAEEIAACLRGKGNIH